MGVSCAGVRLGSLLEQPALKVMGPMVGKVLVPGAENEQQGCAHMLSGVWQVSKAHQSLGRQWLTVC
jgi:hypothetical protein